MKKSTSKLSTARVTRIGSFDPEVERKRFTVDIKEPDEGTGFVALVKRKGETHGWAYRSDDTHGKGGIFPNEASARKHGEQWIDAKLLQLFRIEELRQERQAKLADRLAELAEERAEKKQTAKTCNDRVKKIEKVSYALIEEARNPQVAINFAPSSDDFTIFDGPAVSDGTDLDDERQTDLPIDDGRPEEPREMRRPGINPDNIQWPEEPSA